LSEISPQIAESVVEHYKQFIIPSYRDVSHPLEVNGLVPIQVVRETVHVNTPVIVSDS
jgi:hypothetical protein